MYTRIFTLFVPSRWLSQFSKKKTQIPAYQSTVSRCNIIRSTQTRHIKLSPHYHTIIAIKPHAPSSPFVFSVHPRNFVTFHRPRYDFVPKSFLENLRPCELTAKNVWQTWSPSRNGEVGIASRGQEILSVASENHVSLQCLGPIKNILGKEDGRIIFVLSPISTYCYDLMKTLSTERVLMQYVSRYQAPDPRTVFIYFLSNLQNRLCDISSTYRCFMSRRYSVVSPIMFGNQQHIFVRTVVFTLDTKKDLRNIRLNRYQ